MSNALSILAIMLPSYVFAQDAVKEIDIFEEVAAGNLITKFNTFWQSEDQLGLTNWSLLNVQCYDCGWRIEFNIIISDSEKFLAGDPVAINLTEPGSLYRKAHYWPGEDYEYDSSDGTIRLTEMTDKQIEVEMNFTLEGNGERVIYVGKQKFKRDY